MKSQGGWKQKQKQKKKWFSGVYSVNKTIIKFQKEHLIKDKVAERLLTQNPRTPRF